MLWNLSSKSSQWIKVQWFGFKCLELQCEIYWLLNHCNTKVGRHTSVNVPWSWKLKFYFVEPFAFCGDCLSINVAWECMGAWLDMCGMLYRETQLTATNCEWWNYHYGQSRFEAGTKWADFGEASGGSQRRFCGVKKDQEDNFGRSDEGRRKSRKKKRTRE
jgi:hypothetical protein